jgi:hypothetical protein
VVIKACHLTSEETLRFSRKGMLRCQVFHFVAWRKQGMQVVYEAYMKKGLMCAYHTFASLPHLEKQYDDGSWLARTTAVMKTC